jgi:hypothetical protein
MKTIGNALIRVWIIIANILILIGLILSTIGMLWIPYWILTGRILPQDVVDTCYNILPKIPKKSCCKCDAR